MGKPLKRVGIEYSKTRVDRLGIRITVYAWVCPHCSKTFYNVFENALLANVVSHLSTHGLEPSGILIYEKTIEV